MLQAQTDAYKSRLESLRPKYHAALAERRLTAIAYLTGEPGSSNAASLRSEAHKTAGTAGSFGYSKLTSASERLCRALDEAEHGAAEPCQAYLASIEEVLSA